MKRLEVAAADLRTKPYEDGMLANVRKMMIEDAHMFRDTSGVKAQLARLEAMYKNDETTVGELKRTASDLVSNISAVWSGRAEHLRLVMQPLEQQIVAIEDINNSET